MIFVLDQIKFQIPDSKPLLGGENAQTRHNELIIHHFCGGRGTGAPGGGGGEENG